MADAFIHLTACEQLSRDPRLHPEIAALMARELPAAKLGAIFVDLPHYENLYGSAVRHWLRRGYRIRPWIEIFHQHKPAELGVAFAEIARMQIEFSEQDWPMAFVAGYFSHLAFDRVIHALVGRLVRENMKPGDDPITLHFNCEKVQGLMYHRELYDGDLLGTRGIRDLTRIDVVGNCPRRDQMIQFMVKGCLKGLARSPREKDFDRWTKGFGQYAGLLASPIAKFYNIQEDEKGQRQIQMFYRNHFFNYVTFYNRAMEIAVDYINNIWEYVQDGDFSRLAREAFFEIVPEMDIATPPEEEILFDDSKVIPFIDPRKVD